MKRIAVCCLLVLLAVPAMALESDLVKDINPGPPGSDPWHLVTFNDAVLFFAVDGSGRELWRSDGTDAGTFQVSETGGGELPDPQPFLVTEGLYFFLSNHPLVAFTSLWVSDGTEAGTLRLTGPDVGVAGLEQAWVASQGLLYFKVRDAAHGIELWSTDGTPEGTHLVADVRPGPEHSNITELAEHKGQVWFGADDGQHGGSLWRSDGTAAGTVLAVDPFPASASHVSPDHVQAVGNRITFFTQPPGFELSLTLQLWGGDGTAEGTTLVSGAKTVYDHVVRGNRLYFIAESKKGQQLWVSDGTLRGTRSLTKFRFRYAFLSLPGLPRREGLSNGRFLFWANDGTHNAEPWITDGTPGGTRLLRDLCPGECFSIGDSWYVLKGRLYFTNQVNGGRELWSTDGTGAGTRLVSGKCPKDCPLDLYAPFVVGGRFFFVARDAEHGEEVWSTTGKGMVRVTDFAPPFIWEEDGFHGAVLDGKLLFGADDGLHGMELWAITPDAP